MITLLSGGTGTPKLLQGFMEILDPEDISVIVNTAEDRWLSHGYFSPDIDTVVYTLAGMVDDDSWHGIRGDTHHTHDKLLSLGYDEYLRIGDLDRAVHIWRGDEMRREKKLSEITKTHCDMLGVKAHAIPMSDDAVETWIETEEGRMNLHEFWVKHRGRPTVKKVGFRGVRDAIACREALRAIENAEKVIMGPSNPVTSIAPIISIADIRSALVSSKEKVIGVSPLIGGSAFSGPAEKLMEAYGMSVSSFGVADFYKEVLSCFIVDRNETDFKAADGMRILKSDIHLNTLHRKKALADFIMEIQP